MAIELPAVMTSGRFTTRDKNVPLAERLTAHGGLLCADRDDLTPEQLEECRKRCEEPISLLPARPLGPGLVVSCPRGNEGGGPESGAVPTGPAFNSDVMGCVAARDGGMWCSWGGIRISTHNWSLCKVSPTDEMRRWTEPDGIPNTSARFVFEDHEQKLWIGTSIPPPDKAVLHDPPLATHHWPATDLARPPTS